MNASTGSVFVTLSEYGNKTYKYDARLYTSTTYSDYTLFSGHYDKDPITDFGVLGAFLATAIMALLALLFSFSAIAVMAVTVVGVVVMSLTALAPFTTTFILGLGTLVFGLAAYLMRS